MILQSINIANFKNIPQCKLEFSPKFNCLLGDNGMGKSNLLDAIYFLSFCKSFTGVADSMLISRGQDFSLIQAEYSRRSNPESLSAALRKGRRKSLKRSGKEYQKLSQHIGAFPLALVSPADMELVNGSGEERRKLMDVVISQTDARYLDALIRYSRALEQRNSLLRDGIADPALYMAIEGIMEVSAAYICSARAKWVAQLSDLFQKYYSAIAGPDEIPSLSYVSHLADPKVRLTALFDERRARDAALKYTTAGPHRDDIDMQISSLPVRRSASQGQSKTYTIAMRLAQYEFLKEATGLTPLLLLDDIFDKLDATRVEKIMSVVSSPTFGQIFITDTNRKHLDEILQHGSGDYALWKVHNGIFDKL
ncbi:MAG: DNA replication and repair protein RecF [Clostridium sp.]|nr:DNA replication and repair protein RecF [Clostridium sp.]